MKPEHLWRPTISGAAMPLCVTRAPIRRPSVYIGDGAQAMVWPLLKAFLASDLDLKQLAHAAGWSTKRAENFFLSYRNRTIRDMAVVGHSMGQWIRFGLTEMSAWDASPGGPKATSPNPIVRVGDG